MAIQHHKLKDGHKILTSDHKNFNVPKKRKILVASNPRSGTHTMTEVLRTLGLDVQHEHMGKDGTCSGFFTFPAIYIPLGINYMHYNGEYPDSFKDYKYDLKVQMVRDPRKTIRSIAVYLNRP